MNEKKMCFIMCVNNELYERECIHYIRNLRVPEGFEVELKPVRNASSMTEGYNFAMRQSDAKYKVYLHQDVFIVNKNLIFDILPIFSEDNVGMIGMVGSPKLPPNAIMWTDRCVGKIFSNKITASGEAIYDKINGLYQEVEAIDGLLMITQYDISWREDLFKGWDFYDISQSMEFRKRGYQVVVPAMEESWCFHDGAVSNLEHYFDWREKFFAEYQDMMHP